MNFSFFTILYSVFCSSICIYKSIKVRILISVCKLNEQQHEENKEEKMIRRIVE